MNHQAIIDDLTKVSFEFGSEYDYNQTPTGYFLKFVNEKLYAARKITILPFDEITKKFHAAFGDSALCSSLENAKEAERLFLTRLAYKVEVTKPYKQETRVEEKEADSYEDILQNLEQIVDQLLKDGYQYTYRNGVQLKPANFDRCIEWKEEMIKKILMEDNVRYSDVSLSQQKPATFSLDERMNMSQSSGNRKRNNLSDDEVLVSKKLETALKSFQIFHQSVFIRLDKNGLVKDAVSLHSYVNGDVKYSYMFVSQVIGFDKSVKPTELFEETEWVKIDPDKFDVESEQMETEYINHLFDNGFIHVHLDDHYGVDQVEKLKNMTRSAVLVYDDK